MISTKKFLLPKLILNFLFFYSINACGITTHTEIGHRAASSYEHLLDNKTSVAKLISQYQSAFQAGNPYPDSFYSSACKKGVLASISEDTHWVPFLNATINFIRTKYSKPYNEDALRLIVFTLGYVSHQMADVTWHSLGIDQGFLSAMGFVNFHGVFDKAHTTGDIGGDIINQFELNTKYISDLGDWYVPVEDLYEIYKEFYGKELIKHADIIECSSLLFLGRLGEQIAISLLYSEYFKKSVFLADRLNDYFLGGLDDMAAWTQISWDKVFYMLNNGPDQCILDRSIMNVDCKNNLKKINKKKLEKNYRSNFDYNYNILNLDNSYIESVEKNKGIYFKPSKKFYLEKYRMKELLLRTKYSSLVKNPEDLRNAIQSNTSYFVLKDNARLGYSLISADLNNDQNDDLIIGSPVYSEQNNYQNGAVFVVLSKQNSKIPFQNLDLNTDADIVLKPPAGVLNSRFGHSIVSMDLNSDGYQDLIISAPSFDLENKNYKGKVKIYFGNSDFQYKNISIEITCNNLVYCNLGWTLTKGDLNNDNQDDLIISSPFAKTCDSQCGFVGVLFSNKKNFPNQIDANELDWILNGNMAYEWFGFSIKAKFGQLVVGAPQSRLCYLESCEISDKDVQSVGRVYIYKYPSKTPFLTFNGNNEFEQFGYSFDLSYQNNKKIIAISSMTKESSLKEQFKLSNAGIVQIFDLTMNNNSTLIASLKSDRSDSGFGSKVKFFDTYNNGYEDLYVNAHTRSDAILALDKVQEGFLFVFKGGLNFPKGNYTDECATFDFLPCPKEKAYLLFQNEESKSKFGFEFTVLKSANKGKNILAVSSINSANKNSRLSGKISLFSL